MKNDLSHSLRVSSENWIDEERFHSLLGLLEKYPSEIGQIALFSSAIHAPLPLNEFCRRAELQRARLQALKDRGFSAGINILATIGHHEEDLADSLHGDYTFMTDRRGEVCRGSYCMNDERFLAGYVRPIYRAAAGAKPDFIWIDDDVRCYGHMPLGNCCFCENCISLFNQSNGTSYTRETLVKALDAGDIDVRRAWLEHNTKTISRLFSLIGSTVREVDESITLGFMTGERFFEGYAFREWAEALSDNGKYEIMWRPGGGAYEDFRYDEILRKAEMIGRQNVYLPEYVTVNQSESENFPHQLIKKTPTSTALEAAWTMTAGCTGTAFNIIPGETKEPLETVSEHLRAISEMTPFYRLLRKKTAGLQPSGICTGWRPDSQIAVPAGVFDDKSGDMYASFAREVFSFGLPQCYRPDHACVTLVRGTFGAGWSQEELAGLLQGGVYMDTAALAFLNGRGFAAQTGFEVGDNYPLDALEKYADVPENVGIVGGLRNGRQAFHRGDSFGLLCGQPGAKSLASLVDYHDRKHADCCLGIYKNNGGGRICAAGYYPFSWVSDYNKTVQLKRLMVWLSRDTLPSYVDSYARVCNHTFVEGDSVIVALINPTNQPLKGVRIAVKTQKTEAVWYSQNTETTKLFAEKQTEEGGNYRFFTAESLPAFEMALLEV